MTGTPGAFYDPDESTFYGACVEAFLSSTVVRQRGAPPVVELGVGSGEAVCQALRAVDHDAVVDGYELDPGSCDVAARTIAEHGYRSRYRVTNADFFGATSAVRRSAFVIANPPYLPSLQQSTSFPVMSGGPNGSAVTDRLIRSGFPALMVMLSSFSDPLRSIELAAECGYSMVGWMATPLARGCYSNRESVRRRIDELAAEGRAFVRANRYLLAGVTWVREPAPSLPDRSPALVATIRDFPTAADQASLTDQPPSTGMTAPVT